MAAKRMHLVLRRASPGWASLRDICIEYTPGFALSSTRARVAKKAQWRPSRERRRRWKLRSSRGPPARNAHHRRALSFPAMFAATSKRTTLTFSLLALSRPEHSRHDNTASRAFGVTSQLPRTTSPATLSDARPGIIPSHHRSSLYGYRHAL